jgi:glycerophosphoryl diester phosphodiesterase
MKKVFLILILCGCFMQATVQSFGELPGKKQNVPLICGHRGGFYDNFPEDSLSAFNFTLTNCAPSVVAVELDIRKSSDGTLFIMHDRTVERTTNGHGDIAELSDSYLTSLFLRKANGELTNERIPTFNALLLYAQAKNIILMLDIRADVWSQVMAMLVQKNLIMKSIVLTFNPSDAQKVRELSKDITISYLIENEKEWEVIKGLAIPADHWIAYVTEKTSEDLLAKLKNSQVRIMTDVSEHARQQGQPLSAEAYLGLVKRKMVDVLITDFPVDVCKKLQ